MMGERRLAVMPDLERTSAVFGTTQWTLLASLRADDSAAAEKAAERLILRYWPAVYAYLRGCRLSRNEASELTQGFFADVVLGRKLLNRANPASGRLRNYILTALERYRIDRHRRVLARGGERVLSTEMIDHEEQRAGRDEPSTPQSRFDRRWAVAGLEEALRRCEQHFRASGKSGHWSLFEERVLRPALSMSEPPLLDEVASASGFDSAANASAAVQTVKKRVMALLREVVAETLDDPTQLDDEIAQLLATLKQTR